MQFDAMFVDPMAAKYGAQSDGYPNVHDGLSLVKSDACESGYKGVSISRAAGSITCFQARDGSCMLGAFPTRVEAAVAFARSRETTKDVCNHQRQERPGVARAQSSTNSSHASWPMVTGRSQSMASTQRALT